MSAIFMRSGLITVAFLAILKGRAIDGFSRMPLAPQGSKILFRQTSRAFGGVIPLASQRKDQAFPTWSFDEPCTSMEWNELVPATLSVSKEKSSIEDADLVIVGVFAPASDDDEKEGDEENGEAPPISLSGIVEEIDDDIGGALTTIIQENAKSFKNGATPGSTTPTLHVMSNRKSKRYVVIGLGKLPTEDKPLESTVATKIGATIATKCDSENKVVSCSVVLPEMLEATPSALRAMSTSIYSTLYADNRFRTGKNIKKPAEDLASIVVVIELSSGLEGLDEALVSGRQMATGILMTKDIVNSPHNVLNSLSLADTAKRIAQDSNDRIKCTILGKKECEDLGMGAFLGVARGSETEPQFIHLTYTPPGESSKELKKVGVVGKGLLFDTGGYDIKTSMMGKMKYDCGGAAAVLGAARAVALLEPEGVEAHFLVAACENMIGSKAMVPGDILTASNGKTIEVLNTDAEGRLTLADALVYADKELGCEACIELATLTGACVDALGDLIAGMWTSNDNLAKDLEAISKETGEKTWRMPLTSAYSDSLESRYADLNNDASSLGGATTAALFLQNFFDEEKPFAHLDIAGPVWNDSMGSATGYGAKLVTEWVTLQGQEREKE